MINIIGGAGFVGTKLAEVLREAGQPFNTYDKALSGKAFVDVTLADSVQALPPADVVINLAAEHRDDVYPKSLYDLTNVDGARNVCAYCSSKSVSMIVFTSSVAVYGFPEAETDESGDLNPFNDYGRTKMEAELIYREWQAEAPFSRTLVIVRPTVIFGEGNRGNVYNLLNQIARQRFVMVGKGTNRKSMAYVQNVAEFLAFSTTLKSGIHLFNYVDKPDLDMNTLVAETRGLLFGKKNIGLRIPAWLGVTIGFACDAFAKLINRKLTISHIRVKKFLSTTAFNTSVRDAGFHPSYELIAALKRTVKYEFLECNDDKQVFFTE